MIRAFVVALLLSGASIARGQGSPGRVVPLVGNWQLNLARTHYGPGVDRRRRETFICTAGAGQLQCSIRSVRSNAQLITEQFSAPLDGSPGTVTGIAGVDAVVVKRVSDTEMDATFSFKGASIFAYRAFRTDDGRTLIIVSVDPVSRTVQNAVVVYDRH